MRAASARLQRRIAAAEPDQRLTIVPVTGPSSAGLEA
jgi:hypothetical protein